VASLPAYVTAVATGVLLLSLGFVAFLTLGSQLENGRDQQVLYNDLRQDLANAVAPVGPVDSDGVLLPAGAPVGVISIPSLGVEAVVVEGTRSADTMKGPGHRRDTVLPGQVGLSVIMGRQAAYGGVFRALGEIAPGAEVRVVTGQGVAVYKVDRIRRAGDLQPLPLAAGQSRLTLVTGEGVPYMASSTLRVDATLVSTTPDGAEVSTAPFPAVRRLISAAALPDSERPMGLDTSQIFALVLWAQAFLAAVLLFTWSRYSWGSWQTWTVGLPVLIFLGWEVSSQLALLLPNLT
jgi:LPXTG-site transpeptidase (sortase) family protein